MGSQGQCALIFLFASLIIRAYAPFGLASESAFSVIWITDTQYLSQTYPSYFDSTCNWIVNNRNAYNVKMVVHTGDIVNDAADLVQWGNANHSMGVLLDSGIPYCWDAGNHDRIGASWNGKNFAAFNATAMRQNTYWEGDSFDGKNTAVSFNFANHSFLIINIEFHADSTELQWANNLLDAHPNAYVIVATHAYLNDTCGYDDWASGLRENVLTNHSHVFMTLNGHYHSSSNTNHTTVGNRHELFFDYQNLDSERGGATVRILTFNMLEGRVDVKTYKSYTGQFVADSDNQFTLSIPLDAIPEFPANILPLMIVLTGLSYILSRVTPPRKRALRV